MKLRLKRKVSGNKIRQAERQKRLQEEGKPNPSSIYFKNKVHGQKKKDNPNLLTEDSPVVAAFRDLRLPKKGRKTAWKRFRKSFPYITVTKSGGKRINQEKLREFRERQEIKNTSR